MRSYKVFLNLLLLFGIGLVVYIFYNDSNYINTSKANNVYNEFVLDEVYSPRIQYLFKIPISSSLTVKESALIKEDYAAQYSVWCTFTKVKHKNSPLRYKFERFVHSVLKHSSVVITLHVISDNSSRIIAESVIKKSITTYRKYIKSVYHDVGRMASSLSEITEAMQPLLNPIRGGYYSDSLFYISLGLYRLSNRNQSRAVMLDVDIELRVDILLLFKQFESFSDSALVGLVPELTPVYHHILFLYRSHNNGTKFGSPLSKGGFPGLNSGVILFRFDRLRNSSLYQSFMNKEYVNDLISKYSFVGQLGDQDMYTLIAMEYPELIHILPCGWNRQLCTWWKDHGYPDVFENFAKCNDFPVKIYHGNCNTPIPRSLN